MQSDAKTCFVQLHVDDTGFDSSWSWRTRRCEVVRIGDRDYAGQILCHPSRWAFRYTVNVSNTTESMCDSTLEPIRCCRREGENNLNATEVAMVPYELENPWSTVPNESSCKEEHFLL